MATVPVCSQEQHYEGHSRSMVRMSYQTRHKMAITQQCAVQCIGGHDWWLLFLFVHRCNMMKAIAVR